MPRRPSSRTPRTVLDGAALRLWCEQCVVELGDERGEIDALNVFPVPDGDTGTNLYQTMESAAAELRMLDDAPAAGKPAALADVVQAIARGAFLGARGNSGVILSQMLRGIAEAVTQAPGLRAVDGLVLAAALRGAADSAYAAVGEPAEGTMLSVVAAAAAAADAARHAGQPLLGVAAAAHDAARVALTDSPNHLAVLRRYGVVDAGGAGVVVLLRVLEETVSGVRTTAHARPHYLPRAAAPLADAASEGAGDGAGEGNGDGDASTGPAYEVMYLLEASDAAVDNLRGTLAGLGDSLLVVGGDGLWNVHIHVDDPGAAVEAGVEAGRPHRVRITPLDATAGHGDGAGCAPAVSPRTVLVLCDGAGFADLATQAGALVVPAVPPPTSADIATAVRAAGAAEVLALVADESCRAPTEAAAHTLRATGVRVAVLPTRSPVQLLAALAVHDTGRDFDDDLVGMTAAARSTRTGAVIVAAEAAATMAGLCAAGDVLGVVDGDVVLIGDDPGRVAYELVTKLLTAGGELVTLVAGRDCPESLASELAATLGDARPGIECEVHVGGQAAELLLVGVE